MGCSPELNPGIKRGSPPTVGNKYPFSSGPIPATHCESGEMTKAVPFTPSTEIGWLLPDVTSRTYSRTPFPGSFPVNRSRLPSGNQCAQAWLILSLVSAFPSPAPVVSSLSCEGVACVCETTDLPSGDSDTAPPSPSNTAGEPSVLRT